MSFVPIWFDGLAVGQIDVAADGALFPICGPVAADSWCVHPVCHDAPARRTRSLRCHLPLAGQSLAGGRTASGSEPIFWP
jgi:hypothetical protein